MPEDIGDVQEDTVSTERLAGKRDVAQKKKKRKAGATCVKYAADGVTCLEWKPAGIRP